MRRRRTEKRLVASDLAERLAKFKTVKMPFDDSAYSERERQMIQKLVDALRLVDDIYWRQSDPAGLKLYLSLADSKIPADLILRRYLQINGSRFDLIGEDQPFVGTAPAPPGRGFYSPGLTQQRIEDFVAKHPDRRKDIYNSLTVIHETKDGDLEAIPYHVAYKEFLEPMAQDLVDAAVFSDDPAFSTFLRLRSKALLTDDYYASDIAVAGFEESEIRRDPGPLRNLSGWIAGGESELWGLAADPQRGAKPETGNVSEVCAGTARVLAATGGGLAIQARKTIADGSDGRAVPFGRPGAWIPGGSRQFAERSARA